MNKYYLTQEDCLQHHGILGQRWGHLNGPLYPLGSGDHSARERKEGYTKSKLGKRNDHLYDRNDKKYYEKDVDKNSWLLDLDTDLANEMFETNTKRSKNAYEKAREAYDKYEQDGSEYVRKRMAKEFGKDFSDWNKEQDTQAAIAIGVAFAGAVAFYTMPLWLMHSDSDN